MKKASHLIKKGMVINYMRFRQLGGVHVPHRKNTAKLKAVRMPVPETVSIPLSMHIGAPAVLSVKVGDHVDVGQVIGESGGFVSAPIHASISGIVKSIGEFLSPNGRVCPSVVISADGEQTVFKGLRVPEVTDYDSFINAVRESGAVGLGGAGFPTAVKLAVKGKALDAVIINGAECEPYITSDTRTMIDDKEDLFDGIRLLQKYLAPARTIIAVEKNKPECVKALSQGAPEGTELAVLPSVYPQGGEKVLIYHTIGRMVPEGKLPIDVGAVVINCTTLAFLARYMRTGMPLVEKTVTVDGSAVAEPKNVTVPIGTKIEAVFDFCGGFRMPAAKVLYGGPMMGTAIPDLSMPVLKNTNALLAFNEKEATLPQTTACIRCGACASHCPLQLNPQSIAHAYRMKDDEALEKLKVNLCMECGCCSYICPARRPLVEQNRLSKARLNAYLKNKKEAGKS